MASKEKNSVKPTKYVNPYKDPVGGVVFSYDDWKRKFLPDLLKLIDKNVQELKLRLKFDKEPPQKQGMFNRLSNWWSNIFWGKHNKYHNPYYHRNILGALGAPSKKNEMTLGIYKILKEASEKYELLTEKRLVVDDIIDDWLADLNTQIRQYIMLVGDENSVPSWLIKAVYDAKKETVKSQENQPPSQKQIPDTTNASSDQKADVKSSEEIIAASKSGSEEAGLSASGAADPSVTVKAEDPSTAAKSGQNVVYPDVGDETEGGAEIDATPPEATPAKKSGGKRIKAGPGPKLTRGTKGLSSLSQIPMDPSEVGKNAGPPEETSGGNELAGAQSGPSSDTDVASELGGETDPNPTTIMGSESLEEYLKNLNKKDLHNYLAANGWRESKKSFTNPHGIEILHQPREGEIPDIIQNVVANMDPRTKKRYAKEFIKKTGIDPSILESTLNDDIDYLNEIEADDDEYDDLETIIKPVDFKGTTLYERTLICLENLRKK